MGTRYEVTCFMRVDADEPERYDTFNEAHKVADSLRAMNPEDIFMIEEV